MKGFWKLLPKLLPILIPGIVSAAQTAPSLQEIVARLERLEQENATLREEIKQLKTRMPETGAVEERLEIQERRTEEQAQTKVEASQRFPIRVSGMAVINSYLNSRLNSGNDNPAVASLTPGKSLRKSS